MYIQGSMLLVNVCSSEYLGDVKIKFKAESKVQKWGTSEILITHTNHFEIYLKLTHIDYER